MHTKHYHISDLDFSEDPSVQIEWGAADRQRWFEGVSSGMEKRKSEYGTYVGKHRGSWSSLLCFAGPFAGRSYSKQKSKKSNATQITRTNEKRRKKNLEHPNIHTTYENEMPQL